MHTGCVFSVHASDFVMSRPFLMRLLGKVMLSVFFAVGYLKL